MKFSGKICFKIILKVTKNQGSTLSIEDTFFKKPKGEGGAVNLTPSPSPLPARLGLRDHNENKAFTALFCAIPTKNLSFH